MTLRTAPGRLLRSFITLPLLIVAGFVVLAYAIDWLDNHADARRSWGPLRLWLSQYVGDTQSAIGTLSAIAGSLITVTSITFSILLLAVQQGAAVLNAQVVDHYLARAANRAWLGFFVGVSVFVLITLVQTTHTSSPVFGVIVSALLGALSLLALVELIRSTIDQTRPSIVVGSIHLAALAARERQLSWLAATTEPVSLQPGLVIATREAGRLRQPDAAALFRLLDTAPGLRLTVTAPIGEFLPSGAPIALLHGEAGPELVERVAAVLTVSPLRDVGTDAGASLDHLATIGWTVICTAKSDPDAGAEVLNALHDLLRHWAPAIPRAPGVTAIAYRDVVPDRLLDALESAIVAASESRQHQSLAHSLDAINDTLPLWSPALRHRIEGMASLVARTLADHKPSFVLRSSVQRIVSALDAHGAADAADALRTAARSAWTK